MNILTQQQQTLDLLVKMYTQFKNAFEYWQQGKPVQSVKAKDIANLLNESYLFLKNYSPMEELNNQLMQADIETFLKTMILQLEDLVALADQDERVQLILMRNFKKAIQWNQNEQLYRNVSLLRSQLLNQSMNINVKVEVIK